MSYQNYLKSNHWQNVRRKKHESNKFFSLDKCAVCDSEKRLEVHHLTYKNLWNENNKTLRIICHRCHEILSSLPKLNGNGGVRKKWLKLRKQVLELTGS